MPPATVRNAGGRATQTLAAAFTVEGPSSERADPAADKRAGRPVARNLPAQETAGYATEDQTTGTFAALAWARLAPFRMMSTFHIVVVIFAVPVVIGPVAPVTTRPFPIMAISVTPVVPLVSAAVVTLVPTAVVAVAPVLRVGPYWCEGYYESRRHGKTRDTLTEHDNPPHPGRRPAGERRLPSQSI